MSESIAVVTGAGSGIGRAIAIELSRRGLKVLASDLDGDAAAAVAGELRSGWSEQLDVTDRDAVNELAQRTAAEHRRLDVWVSSAGTSTMAAFVDVTEADLDRALAVNLKGTFLCGQAAARAMRQLGNGGVIVNIASMAGKQGKVPFLADYVASKFGVIGLTQAMAFELAGERIRVNSVCPGYVATPMQQRESEWEASLRGVSADRVLADWVADTPMGRLQQPEDVARVVAFLVSEDAAFITGEAIAVNGGAFMD
jgi:meso-butanediol dehydrogenase / (S,S)-butanediol dehydrogenase / diacetyl reductase